MMMFHSNKLNASVTSQRHHMLNADDIEADVFLRTIRNRGFMAK